MEMIEIRAAGGDKTTQRGSEMNADSRLHVLVIFEGFLIMIMNHGIVLKEKKI